MEYELFLKLNEAYGATTHNTNHFKNLIDSINWDNTFEADGETYFLFGNLTLMVENLDPFQEAWKPTVMISTELFKELGVH